MVELYVHGRSVWIPGGQLEAIYGKSSKVSSIFIHGDRAEEVLVAVVVPSRNFVQDEVDPVKKEVLSEFQSIGSQLGLPDYQIPKGIVLVRDIWDTNSG